VARTWSPARQGCGASGQPGSLRHGGTHLVHTPAYAVTAQNWLYYPGSATGEGSIAPELVRSLSSAVGRPSYHADDWEYQ
jgi:hypothetical protein